MSRHGTSTRTGPLGSLHDGQRRWHPFARFLRWAFLLPVAIFAWSSWRLRGALRVGGYVLAAWVLLFGVLVMTAPAQPTAAPVVAATTTVPAPAPTIATVAPPAPVVTPSPVADSVAGLVASPAPRPTHIPRPVTPRPSPKPKPTHPRLVPAPPVAGAGSPVGDTYTNVDGNQVQRPEAAVTQPAGATAKCKDGTWSFTEHHSGTCSGHGGVAQFL